MFRRKNACLPFKAAFAERIKPGCKVSVRTGTAFSPPAGTENVLGACVECGVPSLIYTSSMHVVGPNDNKDHFVR